MQRAVLAAMTASAIGLLGCAQAQTSQIRDAVAREQSLSLKQQSIAPITAATATGDMAQLNAALDLGLDAGLTVSDAKEILVQMVAYTGFPRSLNALGELMKVLDERKQRGIQDASGARSRSRSDRQGAARGRHRQPDPLVGRPRQGPLFEFAPAIDEFLKTHLFGDIFARDNLDWQSRELATVGRWQHSQASNPSCSRTSASA